MGPIDDHLHALRPLLQRLTFDDPPAHGGPLRVDVRAPAPQPSPSAGTASTPAVPGPAMRAVETAIERLERTEPAVRAFLHRTDELARDHAGRLDVESLHGRRRSALHGTPITIKDCIDLAGVPTTAGSPTLADNRPIESAPIVDLLVQLGLIPFGKTNLHEFCFGGVSAPTRNPYDLDRVPGGSSGGTAAAVAAGVVPLGVGTDSAGSVRKPAAFTGVVGFKPTFGLLPMAGIVPLAWSLDTVGFLADSPASMSSLVQAVMGAPQLRTTSAERPLRDLRVGVVADGLLEHGAPDIAATFEELLASVAGEAAASTALKLRPVRDYVAVFTAILAGEAGSLHHHREAPGPVSHDPEIAGFLAAAATVSAAEYVGARRVQRQVRAEIDALFDDVDVIVAPGPLAVAPHVDEARRPGRRVDRPDPATSEEALSGPLLPFSLSGHPSVVLPFARVGPDAMPLGVQLIGPRHGDVKVLRVAELVGRMVDWRHRPPW